MRKFSKPTILIIGCGDLGGEVALQLKQLDVDVIGLSRSKKNIQDVRIIQGDVTDVNSLQGLQQIKPTFLIYCVAAGGQTDAQYKAHYVDGLHHILNTQNHNQALQHVFFVSSTRVYGQVSNVILDVDTTAIPSDFGGERLIEAENLLMDFCQRSQSVKGTVLRLSGIYGPGRLRMIQLAKSPMLWPDTNTWTNRIHRDDAAAFLVHLIKKLVRQEHISLYYLVTDSKPVSQYEVLLWIASKLMVNAPLIIPAIEGGKRLSNQHMLASGYVFKYLDYQAGYAALLAE